MPWPWPPQDPVFSYTASDLKDAHGGGGGGQRAVVRLHGAVGWYQGTTFQATSWPRGRTAWSRMRKKFAAVSSLLSAEMKPEPRVDVALRPGFSSRNSTRAPVPPSSGSNQGARCSPPLASRSMVQADLVDMCTSVVVAPGASPAWSWGCVRWFLVCWAGGCCDADPGRRGPAYGLGEGGPGCPRW